MDMLLFHFISFLPPKLKEIYLSAIASGKPVRDEDWLEFSHYISNFRYPSPTEDEIKQLLTKLSPEDKTMLIGFIEKSKNLQS